MGVLFKGILSGFSGTVGTVIGGSWKGVEYIRSQSVKKRKRSFTEDQLAQQLKFGVVQKFANDLKPLLDVTLAKYAVKMTAVNYAIQHHLDHAVSGAYPTFFINYNATMISKGRLPAVQTRRIESNNIGTVDFNWTDNTGLGKAAADDKSILVAYCPEMNQCLYLLNGPARSVGTASLNVPLFGSMEVHTYLAFSSAKGDDFSPSIYTGKIMVS